MLHDRLPNHNLLRKIDVWHSVCHLIYPGTGKDKMLVHLFKMNKSLICIRHYMSRWMTQRCLFMSFGPIPLLAPISLFLQLLSPYYASVVLLGMFIFFFFPVCCDCFIASSSLVFISWNIQVSIMIFLYISQANAEVQKIFCALNL